MQRDKNQGYNVGNPEKLSRRGEFIYYIGALFFISGIILLILGTISIIFYQIHYGSDNSIILNVVSFMCSGLILSSLGINLLIKQKRNGYYAITAGILFSFVSIVLFLLNYKNNWYYPIITYVIISYIFGLMILMGNAFGNVTLWLIRSNVSTETSKSKKILREYSDEEIERDIENAVQKSLVKAADELQFDFINKKPLKVGNASFGSETVVKVKDDINEIHTLDQTLNPGEREIWGATGVDKTSDLLANALLEKPKIKRSRFKNFFSRKSY